MAPPPKPAVAVGPIFKWDATGTIPWTKTLVVSIKQVNALTGLDDKIEPYLMIYESDKADWNEKGLGNDSQLDPIVAIKGKFDDQGAFLVTKTIALKPVEHCLTAELRLLDKSGNAVPLKDKDGAALAKLVIALPGADLDDNTWELDVALRSSKDKERRQDRLTIEVPSMPAVLLDASKYKDDRFKPDGTSKYPMFIQSGARESYDWFYVHCMSNPGVAYPGWYDYGNLISILEEAEAGAHYVITRTGEIFHTIANHKLGRHAGIGLRASVKGNGNSIGVELAGLIDDLGAPLPLCREVVKLARNPPAPGGTLGAPAKAKLEAAAAFLCHRQKSGGNASDGAATTDRCKKMIGVIAGKFSDANVKAITDLYVPDDRAQWDGNGLPYFGDGRGICNRGLQLLYAHALLGTAAGLELKATPKDRVKVKDGSTTCTHASGCDMDTTGEGITLFEMKKDEVLPGREAGGNRFATVPKDKIIDFCKKQLEKAIDDAHTRGAFRVFADLSDADFNKFVGYTDAQYQSLADLTRAIHLLYQFKHIVTHHYAAEKRKRDPGGYFDWDKYLGQPALDGLRKLAAFKWDPADNSRAPKGFAERTHAGNFPA